MRRPKRGKVDPGFSHSRPSLGIFVTDHVTKKRRALRTRKGFRLPCSRAACLITQRSCCAWRDIPGAREQKRAKKLALFQVPPSLIVETVVIRPTQAQILKGTVNRTTKTFNFFCNIPAKRVKKLCCSFFHPLSILSCNKSGCCRLRKVVVESSSTFATYSLRACWAFYSPRQTCFAASD